MASFDEYGAYDALGLAELVRKREVKPEELLNEAIERTERLTQINAVVLKHYDRAREQIASGVPKGRSEVCRFCSRILRHSGER